MNELNKNHKNDKLLDPDITSLLNVAFAGLGGVGGIFATMTYIDSKVSDRKDKRKKKENFELELKGFYKAIKEIESSLYLFKINIRTLERLISNSNKRLEENLLDEKVRYGMLRLILSPNEYTKYESIQTKIYKSLSTYNKNILAVEKFLQHFPEEMENEDRWRIISESEGIVNLINEINFNFEMTVGDYIHYINKLPEIILNNIYQIRESYKKDRMLGY